MTKKKSDLPFAFRIEPFGDRILLRRDAAESITPGGIVIPDTTRKQKPRFGTVLAIGEGKLLDSGRVVKFTDRIKVGDTVVISAHAGSEVENPDDPKDPLVLVQFEEIQGRILPK